MTIASPLGLPRPEPSVSLPEGSTPTTPTVDESSVATASASAGEASTVQLSTALSRLQQATEASDQDVDPARVSALREAVQQGTYQPKAGPIASGLLKSVGELWRGRSSGDAALTDDAEPGAESSQEAV